MTSETLDDLMMVHAHSRTTVMKNGKATQQVEFPMEIFQQMVGEGVEGAPIATPLVINPASPECFTVHVSDFTVFERMHSHAGYEII